MPRVHERRFEVRDYECDPFGHVNNTNYLRYMQETAFDASRAAGFGNEAYHELGRVWLVRETDISYRLPLHYRDVFTVRTWVQDFRRFRSRRRYELRRGDDLVADAVTDWVFVDTATGKPERIPQAMVDAFFPDGPPTDDVPPREPFPATPAAPPGAYVIERPVAWSDLDGLHHVNNAVYLNYAEDAGMGAIAAYGWPVDRCMAAGFAIVARRQRIEYKAQAVLGDTVRVTTWWSDPRRTNAVRNYRIERVSDGQLLARVWGHFVWVNVQTGRPIRIPADFIADLAPNGVAA